MSNERIADVERLRTDTLAGVLDRRQVLKRGLALGLSAPIIAGLLAACGDEDEEISPDTSGTDESTPTAETSDSGGSTPDADGEATAAEDDETPADEAETPEGDSSGAIAGGGGNVRLLWWQAPTILNPHLAQGTKDFDASQVCLEPLANYDPDGELVPFLASEIPSLENGDVADDGMSVTWRLRQGVKWHDGEDFTADDVAFTYDFVANPDTTATTFAVYDVIESVEVVDDHTLTLTFKLPTPAWYGPFVGPNGMVLPEHIFADHVGAAAREAPANLMPVGTGPFMVREFRPADVVLFDRFEDYWDEGKPYFDSVEMKGGGDSDTVARSVIQTGEGDYAWNIQSQPEILAQMVAEGGLGEIVATPGASAERMMVNFANPTEEVDGAFSEPSTQHPIFQYKEARNAIALAIQRDLIAEQLYGDGGVATSNNLNVPPAFVSPNTSWEYDLEKAQALLDEVGVTGGNLVYQTSVNAVRQRTQEIIKQSLEQLGFIVELKTVEASIFFSSAAGNPDTYSHFYTDLEMYTNGPSSPYPISWSERYRSDSIAQQSNDWSEDNITRYSNPEFDALHDQAQTELDPEVQAELFIAMNDMSVMDFVEIPIIHRSSVAAIVNTLTGYNGATFMSDVWDIKDWRREE